MKKQLLNSIFLFFVSFAVSIALFEGFIVYEMKVGLTSSSSPVLLNFFRSYYWESPYRSMIQFNPDCAVYDPELFYLLKPGECRHHGSRFENLYKINHLGVRDSEKALEGPEVIAIGDSQTMGWGLDQSETYSHFIEETTGLGTLNMGIASYGTARELTLLKRADLSKLKYLVIQYNDNDLDENEAYLKAGMKLRKRPESFWNLRAREEGGRHYFIGANFISCVSLILVPDGWLFRARTTAKVRQEARDSAEHSSRFLNVLSSFLTNMPGLKEAKIIVFDTWNEVHPQGWRTESFAQTLTHLLQTDERYKNLRGNILVLDLARQLNDQANRQLIDNHLNVAGQRLVAKTVSDLIQSLQKPRNP